LSRLEGYFIEKDHSPAMPEKSLVRMGQRLGSRPVQDLSLLHASPFPPNVSPLLAKGGLLNKLNTQGSLRGGNPQPCQVEGFSDRISVQGCR